MPHYRTAGKYMTPMHDGEFKTLMDNGYFTQPDHKGYVALLYYTAIRKTEGLKTAKNQISIVGDDLVYDVGDRLKGSRKTPPLNIPLKLPYVYEIVTCWEQTYEGRIWRFSPRTCYNVVNRVTNKYPHHFRLSRITNFFLDGWTVAQVRSWTGLSLRALEYYIGLVDTIKMGKSLK